MAGECSVIYRYMSRESCLQFDSLPLTSLTIPQVVLLDDDVNNVTLAAQHGVFAFQLVPGNPLAAFWAMIASFAGAEHVPPSAAVSIGARAGGARLNVRAFTT